MTEKEARLIIAAQLHQADVHLRAAMVAAGDIYRKTKRAGYRIVTDDIKESQWYLDEALAHVEDSDPEKSLKRGLTKTEKRV